MHSVTLQILIVINF